MSEESMLPWAAELAGRIDERVITSELLRGNPLNDPHERPVWVYLPPGYDAESSRRYPSVYVVQGYSGQVTKWRHRSPWRQPFPELADGLFARAKAPPVIMVYLDAWTALGGSQYWDSPATGRYHSYLCNEIVPWVDAHYRTAASRAHRAIMGHSSGGYGAMITPMLRPDVFGGFATHAGDALFEVCFQPTFRDVARALRREYDSSWEAFLSDFRSRLAGTKSSDHSLMEMYAYAAAYSADDNGTVRMPFDDTGATIPDIWDRWLAKDPVRMAAISEYAEALRSMQAIWIDAGTQDEYHLDAGAIAFHRAIRAAGVSAEQIHFELFDDKHTQTEYRYPLSLSWLSRKIAL